MTRVERVADLTIGVDGGDEAAEVRSLLALLRDDARFRGRVELVQRPSRPGEIGVVGDVLSVALGPAGTGVALAGALSIWLRRSRTSDVRGHRHRQSGARSRSTSGEPGTRTPTPPKGPTTRPFLTVLFPGRREPA